MRRNQLQIKLQPNNSITNQASKELAVAITSAAGGAIVLAADKDAQVVRTAAASTKGLPSFR